MLRKSAPGWDPDDDDLGTQPVFSPPSLDDDDEPDLRPSVSAPVARKKTQAQAAPPHVAGLGPASLSIGTFKRKRASKAHAKLQVQAKVQVTEQPRPQPRPSPLADGLLSRPPPPVASPPVPRPSLAGKPSLAIGDAFEGLQMMTGSRLAVLRASAPPPLPRSSLPGYAPSAPRPPGDFEGPRLSAPTDTFVKRKMKQTEARMPDADDLNLDDL